MKKTIFNQHDIVKPEHFTQHPETLKCVADLKNKFGENFENLIVSDTLDEDNHQYVNLVQKGGGVLGVALVGYTYILELAGIRFLRLAGTSAGAINTAMLTVIGKKNESKSEKILKYLCELNFFNLVDGKPLVRWLIKNFITRKRFNHQLKEFFITLFNTLLALIILDFIFLAFRHIHWSLIALRICYTLTALLFIIIGVVIFYGNFLIRALRENGHGLNPGNYFYEWMKKIMDENGVTSVTELNEKAETLPPLKVRNPATQNPGSLFGDVTFITSELSSQNKIEFPKMCSLFRDNPDEIHPANFVRASMSIPIFFKSYTIGKIPRRSEKLRNSWLYHFGTDKDIPKKARFVDGGMISDFPINIFYNPSIVEPRLPSFGIDLDDSIPADDNNEDDNDDDNDNSKLIAVSLGEYLGGLFNTIRYYYDKDFLIKNNVFKKGIGKISLAEFNWLNFFISEEDKVKMFVRGAQAATDFLLNFDWPAYQKERIQMQLFFNEKNSAPVAQ